MQRFVISSRRGHLAFVTGVALALGLSGCGTLSGALRADSALLAGQPETDDPVVTAPVPDRNPDLAAAPDSVAPTLVVEGLPRDEALSGLTELTLAIPGDDDMAMAQARSADNEALDEEYDPWEPFNEKMFSFNRNLDRYVLKPVAKVYNVVMPEPFQVLIDNGFSNINFVPRMVNSLLQGKWGGAGRELSRFLINSTAGIGGLFDPAKDYWGIEKSREDFGQTLGVWGSPPGPYVIVPLLEPLTVRDGIGKFVDGFMDPLSYVLPFWFDRFGMKVGDTVNDRSLNLELYQGFEESVIDMYSAVRHGYLQRRERLIRE